MILPGKVVGLKGVIGTTFDAIFLVYPASYVAYKWPKQSAEALWKIAKAYEAEQVSVGSDGKAYVCKIANTGTNPVGDVSGHWEKLTPFNLTGCTAEAKFGTLFTLTVGSGITMGGAAGTVALNVTPVQTATIGEGDLELAVLVKEVAGNLYEYVKAKMKWEAQ